MGYWTYFEGELDIQLEEQHVTNLQNIISEYFGVKKVIEVNTNVLKVADEWKDSGLMGKVVRFIQDNGQLKTGSIHCHGEDPQDVWNICISENEAFIEERGIRMTLSRTLQEHLPLQ